MKNNFFINKRFFPCTKLFAIIAFIFIFASCTPSDDQTPDKKINRDGFKRLFQFSPGKEVTGVYFYADEFGSDASYWFAFSAPPEIIEKIVHNLNLKPTPYTADDSWHKAVEGFSWWNLEERKQSDLYELRDDEKEIVRQLWYNPKTQKCQAAIIYW